MNQTAVGFGAQTEIDLPFLIPNDFQSARCDLGNQRQNVRAAQSSKTRFAAYSAGRYRHRGCPVSISRRRTEE